MRVYLRPDETDERKAVSRFDIRDVVQTAVFAHVGIQDGAPVVCCEMSSVTPTEKWIANAEGTRQKVVQMVTGSMLKHDKGGTLKRGDSRHIYNKLHGELSEYDSRFWSERHSLVRGWFSLWRMQQVKGFEKEWTGYKVDMDYWEDLRNHWKEEGVDQRFLEPLQKGLSLLESVGGEVPEVRRIPNEVLEEWIRGTESESRQAMKCKGFRRVVNVISRACGLKKDEEEEAVPSPDVENDAVPRTAAKDTVRAVTNGVISVKLDQHGRGGAVSSRGGVSPESKGKFSRLTAESSAELLRSMGPQNPLRNSMIPLNVAVHEAGDDDGDVCEELLNLQSQLANKLQPQICQAMSSLFNDIDDRQFTQWVQALLQNRSSSTAADDKLPAASTAARQLSLLSLLAAHLGSMKFCAPLPATFESTHYDHAFEVATFINDHGAGPLLEELYLAGKGMVNKEPIYEIIDNLRRSALYANLVEKYPNLKGLFTTVRALLITKSGLYLTPRPTSVLSSTEQLDASSSQQEQMDASSSQQEQMDASSPTAEGFEIASAQDASRDHKIDTECPEFQRLLTVVRMACYACEREGQRLLDVESSWRSLLRLGGIPLSSARTSTKKSDIFKDFRKFNLSFYRVSEKQILPGGLPLDILGPQLGAEVRASIFPNLEEADEDAVMTTEV